MPPFQGTLPIYTNSIELLLNKRGQDLRSCVALKSGQRGRPAIAPPMPSVKGTGSSLLRASITEATKALFKLPSGPSLEKVARGLPISVPSRRSEKHNVKVRSAVPGGGCQQA